MLDDVLVAKTYRNMKNQKTYEVIFIALDVTANKNQYCVVYRPTKGGLVFVRDLSEFKERFETAER